MMYAVSGPELELSTVENPAPLPTGSPMLAISVSISSGGNDLLDRLFEVSDKLFRLFQFGTRKPS